jgi:hypothetical protein
MHLTNHYQFQPKFKGAYLDKDEAINKAKEFAPTSKYRPIVELKIPFTLTVSDNNSINLPVSVFINNDKKELTVDLYQSLTEHTSPFLEHYKYNPIHGIACGKKDEMLNELDTIAERVFEAQCLRMALQQFKGKPIEEQVKILKKQGIKILPEQTDWFKAFLDTLSIGVAAQKPN